MTWVPLTIRSQTDGSDSTMHPVPVEGRNAIAFDSFDGTYRKEIQATGISLVRQRPGDQRNETVMEGSDLKISVILTESRVAVACSKYDPGGGWRGDPVSMLVLNGLSKTYAAVKTYKKSVVGHIRYPWLRAVGFVEKSGWLSSETIRLHVAGPSGASGSNSFLLDLALPKKTSAKQVASEIAYLAARYRLVTKTYSESTEAPLRALMDPPDLVGEKKRFTFHELPGATLAGPSTAFGEQPEVGGDSREVLHEVTSMAEADEVLDPDDPQNPAVHHDGEVSVPTEDDDEQVVLSDQPTSSPARSPDRAAPSDAVDQFVLIGRSGGPRSFPGAVAIGRNPVRPDEYPDAELLVVDDMSVSKTHAVIGCTGGRLWVFDYHSTNGVTLRSPVGVDQISPGWPQEVPPGAVVDLGHETSFHVRTAKDQP